MKFKQLRFKNFLSYGKGFTTIDLDSNKNINVIGTNGKGKSVFIDALHYVLTGKPFRNIKIPQIVNTINKKNCLVELDVFDSRDNKITIKRGTQPKIFEIYKNNELIDESSKISDYQGILENILGFNSKTLRHTIIMSSMNYKPFLLLTTAEKRLFIDDILNIEIYTKISTYIKKKHSILKTDISDIESDIQGLESNLRIIREMNEKAKLNNDDEIIDIESEIKKLKVDDDKLEKTLHGINTNIIKNEILKLKKYKTSEKNNIKKYDDQLQNERKKINDKCEKDTEDILKKIATDTTYDYEILDIDLIIEEHEKLLSKKINILEEQTKKYNDRYIKIKSRFSFLDDKINDENEQLKFLDINVICPTCKRDIDDSFKDTAIADINNKIQKLNNKKEDAKKLKQKNENLAVKIEKFKEKISDIKDKIKFYHNEQNDLLKKKDDIKYKLKSEINVIKEESLKQIFKSECDINDSKKIHLDKIENIDSNVNDKNIILYKIEGDIKNLRYQLDNNYEIISKYESKIEEYKNIKNIELKDETGVLELLNESRKKLEKLNYDSKIFENSIILLSDKVIKTHIVNKYIPILNKAVNEYLEILEAPYRLKFDKEMNEQIALRGYEKLSYHSFSSGEKARCDLALLFAFLDLSKAKSSLSSNLLILDEIADNSLDSKGIYGVLSILQKLKNKGFTTFVISHRESIRDEFDMTLEATKSVFSKLIKKDD